MTTTATATSTAATSTGALSGGPAAQLRRLRWAVRATLTLGVAASVAANVLHARSNPISQIIAAWPPLALLLTVELISRVPHHRRVLGAIRIAATAVIAGIATWVSYWHLAGVAARYGETGHGAAYLLPISVDGLVIVASVSLVELTARIRAAGPAPSAPAAPTEHLTVQPSDTPTMGLVPATAPALVPTAPRATATVDLAAAGQPSPAGRAPVAAKRTAAWTIPDDVEGTVPTSPRPRPRDHNRQRPAVDHTGRRETSAASLVSEPAPQPRSSDGDPDVRSTADAPPADDRDGADRAQPPGGAGVTPTVAVPAGTAAAVAYWRRRDPDLHPADVAARIGKSERTVRRYWSQSATDRTSRVNGHLAGDIRR